METMATTPEEQEETRFYVYTHTTLDGSIFYVGKGTGRRSEDTVGRNPMWDMMAAKGYRTNRLFINLTEEEAIIREQALIVAYGCIGDGRGPLVNKMVGNHIIRHKAAFRKYKLPDGMGYQDRVLSLAREQKKVVVVCHNVRAALTFCASLLDSAVLSSVEHPRIWLNKMMHRNFRIHKETISGISEGPTRDYAVEIAKQMLKGAYKAGKPIDKRRIIVTTLDNFNPDLYQGREVVEAYERVKSSA